MIGYLRHCSNILPAEFTEEISNYEVLCQVLEKLKELNKKVEIISHEYKDYTDSQVSILKKIIEDVEKRVFKEIDDLNNFLVDKINNDISYLNTELRKYVDNKYDEIINNVKELNELLKTDIYYQLSRLKNYTDKQDAITLMWCIEEINDMWLWLENHAKNITVVSPITNKVENIQKVLNDMWSLVNRGGITCGEYDALGLTCFEYDSKKLSCFKYDTNARKYLIKDRRFLVYNPETGYAINYKRVIAWLTSLHMTDTLTCGEYDNLSLTCEEYDNLEISCYNYDWNSSIMVGKEIIKDVIQ